MQKNLDTIQFEYRYEIQEIMKMIDKYIKQNPEEKKNKTLERFFDLLDVMDMEWQKMLNWIYKKMVQFREKQKHDIIKLKWQKSELERQVTELKKE